MTCAGRAFSTTPILFAFCGALSIAAAGCGPATPAGCASDSTCAAPNPRCDVATGTCVPCLPANDNCATPTHCALAAGAYACTTSCSLDGDCTNAPGKQACCGGACVDTDTDGSHCGSCTSVCPKPMTAEVACTGGRCTVKACSMGTLDCNNKVDDGCEVTSGTDAKNCGVCGNVCKSGANSTTACKEGLCVLTCSAGHANCNNDPADGCEIDTRGDLANCGSCGMKCGPLANANAVCAMSLCTVESCTGTFGDCDALAMDGCELDLGIDILNCGACGNACKPVANATVGCSDSACSYACQDGFGDCNGDPGDGCEVSIGTDVSNCGMCGNACAFPHASASCTKGACGIDSCAMGFGDCDGKPNNGCEVSLVADVNNCGKCANACGKDINNNTRLCKAGMCACAACSYPNAKTKCVVADCVFDTCNAGFGDCNKNLADGCEADVLGDDKSCGACGNDCGNGKYCDTGVCKVNPCTGVVGGHILMAMGKPYRGFCWYLSTGGSSGDDVCADSGGTNKGNDAIMVLMDDCVGGAVDQPSQWFFDHGNAEGWMGPYVTPPTGYRTLGHGYTDGSLLGRKQAYVGRCDMGGIPNVGSFPGEINDTKSPGGGNPDNNCRSVVVACDH